MSSNNIVGTAFAGATTRGQNRMQRGALLQGSRSTRRVVRGRVWGMWKTALWGLALACIAVPAWAAPGDLDPTFGVGGKVPTLADGYEHYWTTQLAIQSDGKLVTAGCVGGSSGFDFALARYNTDGTLDLSFGTGGKVTTDIGRFFDCAQALVVQDDGKLVAAGVSDTYGRGVDSPVEAADFALVRYNSDGTLDSSFGTDGKVTTPISDDYDNASALALVVQSDGKLVAGGTSIEWMSSEHQSLRTVFALARYNSDGTLDPTFGTGGKVTTIVGGLPDSIAWVSALVLQDDGKVVAAGTARAASTAETLNDVGYDFALARYNTDGTLDGSFGTGGTVITPIGPLANATDWVNALVLQSDGKLVAAGAADTNTNPFTSSKLDFALVRYNSDGTLDPSFGTDGKVTTPLSSGNDGASALVQQSDGKLVAVGVYNEDDVALMRYLNDPVCGPTPQTGCTVAGLTTQLLVHDSRDAKRRTVRFKWSKGSFPPADLGDPRANSTLCVYDATARIVGLSTAIGNAKRAVKVHGANVPTIRLGGGLTYPVTAQLLTGTAACSEATFTAADAKINDGRTFSATRKAQ